MLLASVSHRFHNVHLHGFSLQSPIYPVLDLARQESEDEVQGRPTKFDSTRQHSFSRAPGCLSLKVAVQIHILRVRHHLIRDLQEVGNECFFAEDLGGDLLHSVVKGLSNEIGQRVILGCRCYHPLTSLAFISDAVLRSFFPS